MDNKLYFNGISYFFRKGQTLYAVDKIVLATLVSSLNVDIKMTDGTLVQVSLDYAKLIFGIE